MNITIENFKNLKQLNYTIDDNKINFLFGMSGSGKSSILSALADDVPNNYRKFGLSSSDIVQIKVDGTAISPTDTHVFNIEKMAFILDQTDIEHFKEVIVVDNSENEAIHKDLEDKIYDLSNAINMEMSIYEKYGSFLESLKAKKLTKNQTLPATSPFSKVMTKIKALKKSKIFEEIISMDIKLFDWQMKGISFINNNICPFCDKKMSKRKTALLIKMNQFDSKTVGGVKDGINDNLTVLGNSLSYDYKTMKAIEKQIIQYALAIKPYEEIVKQFHDTFEEGFDYKTIKKVNISREFKTMFPRTFSEYEKVFKNIRVLKNCIKRTQEKTETFLKGKKKTINDILNLMNIPYEFSVKYHRSGPNEYSIIHKDDQNKADDKMFMSDGEKAIVSLILFLISSKATNYKIYFIDDPVSSFDIYRRKIIYDLILKYLDGKTTIVLSHDPVFAKFAIQNRMSPKIGAVSYLSNNGKNAAIIQSVKNVSVESFSKSVVERCDKTTNQYEQAILARLLLEEHCGQNCTCYTYLSKILHAIPYNEIQAWLSRRGKTEIDVLNETNSRLVKLGLNSNYLSPLDINYNVNINISNYTIYEKCIILREFVNKNPSTFETHIIQELNNSVHLNDALAIGINVFEFPFISRNLYDEIQKMPNIISI